MKPLHLHMTVFTLTVLGALNWGLIGLLQLDLVNVLFGTWPGLVRLIYILIGASAVYLFITHKKDCKLCSGK